MIDPDPGPPPLFRRCVQLVADGFQCFRPIPPGTAGDHRFAEEHKVAVGRDLQLADGAGPARMHLARQVRRVECVVARADHNR